MPSGRFAPSPTGRLHLGNLRTALVAWLFARSDGSAFLLRMEDLDQAAVRAEHYQTQANDLAALGLHWDGDPIRQTERLELYNDATRQLTDAGLTYPCYCSRREIREATQAPNGPWSHGQYPGTCRTLTAAHRAEHERSGRPSALRLLGRSDTIAFDDLLCGPTSGLVDDAVIRRNDGTPAYNLVVMIDDDDAGIELVVRADDLLDSTPRQIHICRQLGLRAPAFAHVPLVLAPGGDRLAKRDGSVTLADRIELGETPSDVLGYLAYTLGLAESGEPVVAADLVERFEPSRLPRTPLVLDPEILDLTPE
ncbi:MAG: glutamyl-tRNA synthetase [Acidimicrobiales bacterium]|jgi:glutamyl-tRNA synthetase